MIIDDSKLASNYELQTFRNIKNGTVFKFDEHNAYLLKTSSDNFFNMSQNQLFDVGIQKDKSVLIFDGKFLVERIQFARSL